MKMITITGNNLTLDDLAAVCRNYEKVKLSDYAVQKIIESRKIVDEFVEKEDVVYGITTGFGKFSDVTISKEESKTLQENLIISHAVGAGKPFDTEIVRGIILLRINNLAKGYSGARLETIQTMIDMLNKGVHPVVPEKGSLGASGDLAPLSHMVLPMIGLGKAEYMGQVMPGKEAMEKAGIPVINLTAKEGLALINGTQVMTAVGALTIYDALNIVKVADIAAALSFEAQKGIVDALDYRLHEIRPHKGQIETAKILLELLAGSKMATRQGQIRVQDAYSLRCVPQVHGASRDAINYVREKVEIEMNSVTDNPIIFPETREGIS
ncbi:MAG: aromatic amino acid lyase, partial [Sedimentibacter sp.]|nr:aromatic amino acid lyase [Sedimentibacter sp.]